MALLTGLATGIGSLSLYILLSGGPDKSDKEVTDTNENGSTERQEKIEQDKKTFEAQDADDLLSIKNLLAAELKSHSNTPEFQKDQQGDQQYLFTRDFVLKVTRLTHKYHTIIYHVMKKQAEDRRLAAIEAQDEVEYTRAFYMQDLEKMRTATEVEDMIFDHFGIIETQFEAASNHFKEEASFIAEKLKIQDEIKQLMQDEYEISTDDAEKIKNLTKEKAEEYMARIRSYT